MIHLNRRLKYALLIPLFIVSVFTLQFANIQLAFASTLTWTGDGDGTTFADGDNWSTDAAPVDDDIIQFSPLASGTDGQTIYLENDLTGVSFGGLISTSTSSDNGKTFYIDTLTFADGATITSSGSGSKTATVYTGTSGHTHQGDINADGDLTVSKYFSGVFDVEGNLTVTGSNGFAVLRAGSSVSGNVSMKNGMFYTSGLSIGGSLTLPADNGGVYFKGPSKTFTGNLIINDFDDSKVLNQVGFGNCSVEPGGGAGGTPSPVYIACSTYASATYTFSGTVTLNADFILGIASKSTVKFTGTVNKNGHTIKKQTDFGIGTLQVGSSTVTIPKKTTDLNGSHSSTSVTVSNNETATLNGSRGSIQVNGGGTLKGTGSADSVIVVEGGILNPGNSPGKLTTRTYLGLNAGSIYKPELLNKDKYDQMVVGEDYDSPGGHAVIINADASLKVVLYDGWSIKKNDTFKIIDNKSDTDVQGTFDGLDEGDQFEVTSEGKTITFSITYEGGDGNDVVITALNTGSDPTPPNTGAAKLILGNPIVLAILAAVTATLLITIAIRRRVSHIK